MKNKSSEFKIYSMAELLAKADKYEEEVKKIKNAFTYHSPSQGQAGKYDDIRELGLNFALYIMAKCPDSYEAKNAITKIEEAVMWANASIARNS